MHNKLESAMLDKKKGECQLFPSVQGSREVWDNWWTR